MVAFNRVIVGDEFWEPARVKVGSTTMRKTVNYPIKVISVDTVGSRVFASWNHNTPEWFREKRVTKWRRTPAPGA